MKHEPTRAGAGVEAGEHDLINRDRGQTHERDAQGVVMENRYAKQRQPEQQNRSEYPTPQADSALLQLYSSERPTSNPQRLI